MISEKEKEALQAQLQEIKEYGTLNTGYYWDVFKKNRYTMGVQLA